MSYEKVYILRYLIDTILYIDYIVLLVTIVLFFSVVLDLVEDSFATHGLCFGGASHLICCSWSFDFHFSDTRWSITRLLETALLYPCSESIWTPRKNIYPKCCKPVNLPWPLCFSVAPSAKAFEPGDSLPIAIRRGSSKDQSRSLGLQRLMNSSYGRVQTVFFFFFFLKFAAAFGFLIEV